MALLGDAAERLALGSATGIRRAARGGARFLGSHPRLIVGGAAIAGAVAAHPLRPASQAFQEQVFGDRQAVRKSMVAAVNTGLSDALMDPYYRRQTEFLSRNYNVGNAGYSYYGSGYISSVANPNGNIVFGLYNDRMKD